MEAESVYSAQQEHGRRKQLGQAPRACAGPRCRAVEKVEGIRAMKKGGILNPAICSLLAELGHMDELLIVDAGYPLPPESHVIDLTLTPGIPRFLDVLRAVAEELVIESITVATEITEFSPKLYQEILKIVGDVDVDEVPHHEFKEAVARGWQVASSARPSSRRTRTSASSRGRRSECRPKARSSMSRIAHKTPCGA